MYGERLSGPIQPWRRWRCQRAASNLPDGGDDAQALVRSLSTLRVHLQGKELTEKHLAPRRTYAERAHEQKIEKPSDERAIRGRWQLFHTILSARATAEA